MTLETRHTYRGVLCGCCNQPIPVPRIAMVTPVDSEGENTQRVRVFNVRCRACEKERQYCSTDIVEFEGAPRARYGARPASSGSGGQGRAASA
jgi:hypothetical protein